MKHWNLKNTCPQRQRTPSPHVMSLIIRIAHLGKASRTGPLLFLFVLVYLGAGELHRDATACIHAGWLGREFPLLAMFEGWPELRRAGMTHAWGGKWFFPALRNPALFLLQIIFRMSQDRSKFCECRR